MKRKTLEISVHPNKHVIIKAPDFLSIETIQERILKKALWIKKKIAYFEQFYPRIPEKKYLCGESHLYLGYDYKLKIKKSDNENILIKNEYFDIQALNDDPQYIKILLNNCYFEQAKIIFLEIFDNCWETFKRKEFEKPMLRLCKSKRRWGSLSLKGKLKLNIILIQASHQCIEYVVMHELCHLVHFNHSREFYKLLEKIMPDWSKRKQLLEMTPIYL